MIPRPAPITDSPLFWVLLFGSVGLVMLTAVEPKYIERQERITRMQQSRERAHSARAAGAAAGEGVERTAPAWQPDKPASLQPLMLFLAALLIVAMLAMQVRRQRMIGRYRETLAALEKEAHS